MSEDFRCLSLSTFPAHPRSTALASIRAPLLLRRQTASIAESEARLYDLGVLRSVLEESVEIAVADARADGVTWAKIGDALGVTHQAVIKRYGRGGGR